MTLEEVKKYYIDEIDVQQSLLEKRKRQSLTIGLLRLLVFLVACFSVYTGWGRVAVLVPALLICVALFLWLMKIHDKIIRRKKYHENRIGIARDELQGLAGDYSAFDGQFRVDASHPFSTDLDLFGDSSLFAALNRTVTDGGKQKLAEWLLSPEQCPDSIPDRQQAIRELSEQSELLAHFMAEGKSVETTSESVADMDAFLSDSQTYGKSPWRLMRFVSPVLLIACVVLFLFHLVPASIFFMYWIVMMVLSGLSVKSVYSGLKRLDRQIECLSAGTVLLGIIEQTSFKSQELRSLHQKLTDPTASKLIARLGRYAENLGLSFTLLGFIVLNPVLFWPIGWCIKIEKWLAAYGSLLNGWKGALSEFDALVSLAVFATTHPDYTYPQPVKDFRFVASDMGHPMIARDKCVLNDVTMQKHPYFMVVTGANMAGKSTYLRTIGVNLVLACMGVPVFASSMSFYPFKLFTNLRISDSLKENESYFFAELKRLKMMIDALKEGQHLFIILDEILKGTNSEDKQQGSIALVKQLIGLQATGIIATHDLILGGLQDIYPDTVKNYRFEADIRNDNLSFSYKIKEGVAQNMNACFLMKKMGISMD